MTDQDRCRYEFEAWVTASNKCATRDFDAGNVVDYFDPYTQAEWVAWQAAWNAGAIAAIETETESIREQLATSSV